MKPPSGMVRRFHEETVMKCVICRHGELTDGSTTVILERGEATLIFKEVPARVCDNCGEEYVSSECPY